MVFSEPLVTPSVVRFGIFEADLRSGELKRKGVKVKVQDLPFKALSLLLSRPNEVLNREEFRQALWPDNVFVDFDHGITTAINRLREALDDSASNPRFIETLERRGYRWIAPTQSVEPAFEISSEEPPVSGSAPSRRWKFSLALLVLVSAVLASTVWIGRDWLRRPHRPTFSTSPAAHGIIDPHPAANREAQALYLQGRYYWQKRTPDSLNKAVDSFTQALVHDPSYVPAYVGLADCYNLLREYTMMPASEAYQRALAAANKAVELDPQSSEAHASLAFVSFHGMWDAATADREFRRAIELDPNDAVAHHWYATYLDSVRRDPEALAEIERAQALDPGSKSILADRGSILFDSGHQLEAVALLKQMEENEPDFISPHRYLKFIYLRTADYSNYLVEAKKEAVLVHDNAALAMVDATEKAFAAGGDKGLLQALSGQQKKLCDRGQFSPLLLAQTYIILGNKQEALRYLKIAYDQHADGVEQIEGDRAFDSLYPEPAFQELVAKIGLPPVN